MPWLSAGEEKKKQEGNCQGIVLDFDLSKQKCSPISTPMCSDSESSGAFGFFMRSQGQGARQLFVSPMILSMKYLTVIEVMCATTYYEKYVCRL